MVIQGGHFGIQHKNSNKQTSIMNFYAYHMMQRNNFNTILRAGRLFHQYVVDQYAKLEQQRLNYCLFHQNELRSELYQGLADAVQAGDTDGKHTGKKNYLTIIIYWQSKTHATNVSRRNGYCKKIRKARPVYNLYM